MLFLWDLFVVFPHTTRKHLSIDNCGEKTLLVLYNRCHICAEFSSYRLLPRPFPLPYGWELESPGGPSSSLPLLLLARRTHLTQHSFLTLHEPHTDHTNPYDLSPLQTHDWQITGHIFTPVHTRKHSTLNDGFDPTEFLELSDSETHARLSPVVVAT